MTRSLFLLAAACGAALLAGAAAAAPAPLTPAPALEVAGQGAFKLSARTAIYAPAGDAGAKASAAYLADLLKRSRGLQLAVREGAPAKGEAAIVFSRGIARGEAYSLDVTPRGLTISAGDDSGLFYGAVTAWQLATPADGRGPVEIEAVHIEDAPRFAWRGLMLDSVRHFKSAGYVKDFIDRMARAKLNVLHWHLTDDQGWRLEIKKYPKLTEVGAWRVPAGAGPAADIDPKTGKPRTIGGFYTQDEVREIVAYAAVRHITIIPEIEMPGHATALVAAYPQLSAVADPPKAPGSDWGVYENLVNVDDATFGFLQDVLDEVMALFPSPYIHVGGDEAVKPQWKANPAVQARMKELHIGSEDALQGWFTSRMEQYLNAHGRRLIGWDEILEGGVARSATVMSWRGTDGAIVAAKMGHDTILAPAPTYYFDNRQAESPEEPPGRGFTVDLKTVYEFEPVPAALKAAEARHVLGVQAQLWAEHIRTEERNSKMAYPRALALAETGWTPQGQKSWSGFTARLPAELQRERALGAVFDDASLRVQALAKPVGDAAEVVLSGGAQAGEIRYTLDGAAPTAASTLYTAPIRTALPARIRAAAFQQGVPLAAASDIRLDAASIRTRTSQQLKLCSSGIALNLEDDAPTDGERAVFLADIMNPCWIWEGADLAGPTRFTASVGQLPFNFQIGDAIKDVRHPAPSTPEGELVVRQDSCTGAIVATVPLAAATRSQGVTDVSGELKTSPGAHDLCFTFTQRGIDPYWVLNRVSLAPPETSRGR